MAEGASGGALRELFVSVGIHGGAGEALEALDKRMTHLGGRLREFGEALLSALAVERLHSFVEGQAKLGAEVQDTAERLGVGVEELQRLQFAATQTGSTTEDMATGMRFLARNMNDAAQGAGDAAQEFARQGISVKNADGSLRSVQEVMVEVADAIQKLPPGAQRVGLALKLLGRGGAQLIPTLSKGGAELAKLAAQADDLGGVFSRDYTEAAYKAEGATGALSFAWRGAKSAIAMQLFPAFAALTEALTKGAKRFKDLASHTTILRVAFAGLAAVAAIKIVPAILDLVRGLAGVEAGAGLVETALGALPLLLVAALIAAIVLVGDDLITMFEGGDSAIGGMIDTMFGLGESQKLVDNLRGAWMELQDALLAVGVTLPDLSDLFHDTIGVAFEFMASQIRHVIKLVTIMIKTFSEGIREIQKGAKTVTDFATGKIGISEFTKRSADLGRDVLATIGKYGTGVGEAFSSEPTELTFAGARARAERLSQTQVQQNRIEIHNHGVGKDVGPATEKGVRTALDDFQNETAFESWGLPAAEGGID